MNADQTQSLTDATSEREHEEYLVGFRAMMLAPTLELYHALLQGEDVPLHMLNQDAVARYGLRKGSRVA